MTPVTIRASSLGSLFDCPARWIAIHLEGRRVPSSSGAALGKAIHKGTAVFDSDRVAGITPSLEAAVDAADEAIKRDEEETAWQDGERDEAGKIGRSLVAKYCFSESARHDFVAVEASVEALHISDLGIVLTGTTDRVERHEDGSLGIADIKSGKTAVRADGRVETKGHGAQVGVYELVAEAATGTRITAPARIIGLQTNKTEATQRIGTGEIVGAREVLLGDENNTGLLRTAARLVHGELSPWGNPRSMSCSERMCPNFKTCFWRR